MTDQIHATADGYAGTATLQAGPDTHPVEVHLSGRFEPVDGRYHWGGRIAPQPAVTDLVRRGRRGVHLGTAAGPPVPARLGDVDPWGGVRVTGTGPPPWSTNRVGTGPDPAFAAPTDPAFAAPSGTDPDIAIVGAGFGGIGAALALHRAGRHDFLIFERADEIGGTWRDNTYPGCACDVPSHLYSFALAGNPDWTRTYSNQPEILRYLRDCVERAGLRPHLRLGHCLLRADWDPGLGRWRLETSAGGYTARVLITATGPLSEPSIPDIPGLASFAGTTFHSARWRHDHDLTGRRVAVLGTGASAVQFVPAIQPAVAALTVFQRTPPWILPRRSRPIGRRTRAVLRALPGARRVLRTALYWQREVTGIGFRYPGVNRVLQRLAERHLRRAVADPVLRDRLTPDYVMGCKRVLLSDDYLPALTRPNVRVVTAPVREIRPDGVVTADGVEHPVDTIIFGTGFRVTDPPVAELVHGRDGRSLAAAFTPTMRAYAGTTVAGFPNLFMLLGPNTGLGHTSVVLMIESQLRYVLAALRYMHRSRIGAIEPTPQAQQRYVEDVDARMAGTVWLRGGCDSWYLDQTGRNPTLWPGFATTFRLRLLRFHPGDHAAVPLAANAPASTGVTTPWPSAPPPPSTTSAAAPANPSSSSTASGTAGRPGSRSSTGSPNTTT